MDRSHGQYCSKVMCTFSSMKILGKTISSYNDIYTSMDMQLAVSLVDKIVVKPSISFGGRMYKFGEINIVEFI